MEPARQLYLQLMITETFVSQVFSQAMDKKRQFNMFWISLCRNIYKRPVFGEGNSFKYMNYKCQSNETMFSKGTSGTGG